MDTQLLAIGAAVLQIPQWRFDGVSGTGIRLLVGPGLYHGLDTQK
jgi:hypothetical protein